MLFPPNPRKASPGTPSGEPGSAPAAPSIIAANGASPELDEEDDEDDRDDDDSLIDLPPLDEDEGAEQDSREDLVDLLDPLDSPDDPLDDVAAQDLETGEEVELDEEEETGEDDPVDAAVDVGPLEEGLVLVDEERWVDEDTEDSPDHGDGIDDDGRAAEDDGGAEGTGEDPANDVDEQALPALDADEEGTYEGEDLLAELSQVSDDRPPAWDVAPWVQVENAGAAMPCSMLAVAGGRVVAAGGGKARRVERAGSLDRGSIVLLVDPGEHAARRTRFEAAVSSVALAEGAIVVATRRGHLLRSDDGGTTTSALGAWSAGKSAAPMTLAATPGRLWILSEGTLWSLPTEAAALTSSAPPGEPTAPRTPVPPAVVRDRDVLRVAASGGTLVVLTSTPEGPRIERLRGDDEGAPSVPLSGGAREAALAAGGQMAAAAGGQAVALSGEGALYVSRDGGMTFRTIGGLPPVLALAFAGDGEAAPLLALVARDGEGRAQLMRVPASGTATVVAEIGPERRGSGGGSGAATAEERVAIAPAAIGWDGSREVVWIACRSGLFAIGRARTH